MSPTVCFLTVDSIAEGVGRSQIVPVLRQVAKLGWHVKLISFEKGDRRHESAEELLAADGVEFLGLPFGRRGALAGVGRLLRLAAAIPEADVYHCRSDVPYLAARLRRASPVVWDCRSFWAEQRAAAKLISRQAPAYRMLTRVERAASRDADGLITLSHAAAASLEERWGRVSSRRVVIPTVTDLKHFSMSPMPPVKAIRACFSGTFGPNYDPDLATEFLSVLAEQLPTDTALETVWSSGVEGGFADFSPPNLIRMTRDYGNLPSIVAQCHFGIVPIRLDTGPSSAAMMPTKVGEFWASGRPIVVTRGVGDLDSIIRQHRVGVIINSADPGELNVRAREALDLLRDPGLAQRCRSVAEKYFDLATGVDELVRLYESLL